MAHFAQIENGTVVNVIVVHNNELLVDGIEVESKGAEFCHNLLGGVWKQTSYNNNIRKQYAGVGFTYDAVADVFIAPKPFASWSLDANYDWQAPIEPPADGKDYLWDEANQVWVESPVI
jgi:hypothetical protein